MKTDLAPDSASIPVVIIGRPNVGKSTLFNRLIGKKKALVHDLPGVTRDRLEEKTDWWVKGKRFPITVIDTGGMGGERFSNEILNQVQIALEKAKVALFLFDSQVGLTPLDQELLRTLKRSGILKKMPVFAVVNKVDAEVHEQRISDFFEAGLDPVLTISAEHGRGIDDLKEAIIESLGGAAAALGEALVDEDSFDAAENEELDDAAEELLELPELSELDELDTELKEEVFVKGPPRIAIVGRPNVGKSTLLNALLGEDRMITSPIAGTTVDPIDSEVLLDGKKFLFIDTAGIRRKNKTEKGVEVLSVVQTRKTLEKADVAILVLDGEKGISDQDEKIGGLIEEAGCGVILAINKWDTQRKNREFTPQAASELVRKQMAYLKYAPILFMSGLKKQGLDSLGDLIEEIIHQRRLKIPTREFTEWVREKAPIHNPMNAKFYLCHQSGRNPPTFVCHVNNPDKVHFSLRRHLVNALRERWGFMGSPIRMLFVEVKSDRVMPSQVKRKSSKPARR